MHIIIITPRFAPVICGVGDHSLHLAEHWQVAGHKVTVVHRENGAQWRTWNRDSESMSGSLKGLLRKLQEADEEGILFWQYVPNSFEARAIPFGLLIIMASLRRKGWRQAVFFHEVSVRLWGYGMRSFLLAFAQRVIANTMAIMANSTLTSLRLYRSYFIWNKPVLVPISANILPAGDFVPNAGTNNGKEPVVACFANRADRALIRAMAQINTAHPCRLILLGKCSPQQEQSIREWAVEAGLRKFYITGEQDSASISKALSGASVYIHPQPVERSKEGGVSAKNGSMAAAMAHGLPIITTRADMTDTRLFRDGQNMIFVEYHNEQQYTEQISRLLADPATAASLGHEARKTYQLYMDWPVTAKAILKVIRAPIIR